MLMSVVQVHLSPPDFYQNPHRRVLMGIFLCAIQLRCTPMTNAWIQRLLNLGVLLLGWGMAAWLWSTHRTAALWCLGLPFLITPVLLAIQCVMAAQSNRADPAPRATLSQWLTAWFAEWRIAAMVFSWWQPFRHRAITDQLHSTPGQRGMVLVHGFFCNRALWTVWMAKLKAEGRVFVSVDLEPAFGSISDYAAIVEQAIAKVEQATGMPPVIVGHSMGGLAIRAWGVQFARNAQQLARIHRIFTLGTPHQGTAIAQLSHTENGHQMRQGSDWLANNASQLPDDFAQKCTCYYSNCDNIVFPCHTAALPGADNRFLAGHAHVELVNVPAIEQACWAALK
jgi:triacylglycerol lipase